MVSWTVAQKGDGSPRDLIVVAHGGTPVRLLELAPRACVVGLNFPPFKQNYHLGAMLPPLASLVRGVLGEVPLGNLLLVGFSEGCQAPRSWLAAGEVPSAVLAFDGTHASIPPTAGQLDPWRRFFDRARARERHAVVTATRIPTTGYMPTAEVLPLITGFPPAPKLPAAVAGFAPAALALMGLSSAASIEQELAGHPYRVRTGEEGPAWELRGDHQQIRAGYLLAQQWPGGNAAAHVEQAAKVMPSMVGEVYTWLASEPIAPYVRGYSAGEAPPPAPAGVYPTPSPAGPPAPPGRPPGPSSSPPSSSPPSSSSGGGAAGPVLALGVLTLAAMSRRRR